MALRASLRRKERAAQALRDEEWFKDLCARNPNAAVHVSSAYPFGQMGREGALTD
jgi:hypothetical protein